MSPVTRDREGLVAAMEKGHAPKWVFFWGHTPSKDGSVTRSCFSQWWEGAPFEVEGVRYLSAEHFMMAGKARLFGDVATLEQILVKRHPRDAKMLGRKVANFDEEVWNEARFGLVVEGNKAKFSQHPALRDFLLGTGERVLVEASPVDRIWGIGLKGDAPEAEQPWKWKGLNLLGFALMEVRERLRPVSSNEAPR